MRAAYALAIGLVIAAPEARADLVGDTQKQLNGYRSEVQQLDKDLIKPKRSEKPAEDLAKRLVDAQVAFATGRYDESALILYDFVGQSTKPRDRDIALYYLAESLFQKGDKIAARTYFSTLAKEETGSKYYQQSLERLVELAIILGDATGVEEWLSAMDRVPAGTRRPSIAYVRGKWEAYQDHHDAALSWFSQVPKGSDYDFQAQYYAATVQIAKNDLGKATDGFDELLKQEPRSTPDRRVMELCQLALGRLYYERDQPSKSIDSYLLVDRHSDLFDEALYEVAWVYVKGKQFDKALRALELLALTDPLSSKTPTVKILEGNLRIRKAQMVKARLDMGGKVEGKSPAEEYDLANTIFTDTHDTYIVPHDELKKILDDKTDPEQFVSQVTGRSSRTFQVNATMPEIAAAWLREEPEVARVVAIEGDLGEIQDNIAETERTIERIEISMGSANRVNLFPKLAEKRNRGTDIQERLLKIQIGLLEEQRKGATGDLSSVDALTEKRKQVAAELAALPNAEKDYQARIAAAKAEFDRLDQIASETQVAIESTDATIAALKKYLTDQGDQIAQLQKAKIEKEIAELEPEVAQMRAELEDIRKEVIIGRDEAGTGDETALRGRELRKQLRDAIDAEQAAMTNVGGNRQLAQLSEEAGQISAQVDKMNDEIDRLVDEALTDVREQLAKEKADLNSYRSEFLTYEAQSRALGGTVLGQSFKDVKAKFYDIVIRSDVGLVDVSWSQKEDVDGDLARYNLQKNRELKQLRDEFRDLLEEDALNKSTTPAPPAPPPTTEPAPGTEPAPTTEPTPPPAGGGTGTGSGGK
jgi:predicted  nucleic acid-binding Zn-ribbon protein